jgi:hypothetical protein
MRVEQSFGKPTITPNSTVTVKLAHGSISKHTSTVHFGPLTVVRITRILMNCAVLTA